MNPEEINYTDFVGSLFKSGEDVLNDLDLSKFTTLMLACALMIQTGELLDRVKKHVIYGKELDEADAAIFERIMNEDVSIDAKNAFDTMTPEKANLLHAVVGIAGEGTELLVPITSYILGEELDIENIDEEMGDGGFYNEALYQATGLDPNIVRLNNIKKLMKRYENLSYSNASAIERADKQEN